MHFRFHANLYKPPERLTAGEAVTLRGIELTPLREPDGRPPTFDEFFPASFERVLERLVELPRLDAEPDGFFVQSGEVGADRWQLDGHLFDFDGQLHRLELHGSCPAGALDDVLACIGGDDAPVAFELVQEGVALNQRQFRRWASAQ